MGEERSPERTGAARPDAVGQRRTGRFREGDATSARKNTRARKAKISVTVDETLWNEVQALVAEHEATSASAAVEQGLALWLANQRLGQALDAMYQEEPTTRPTEAEVARAAAVLRR